ncbi:pyridoxal-dependent decarboxylase [Brachybacterium sp. NBEC-018]|uniref:pyridoxal phosphate-dependent decarboxylase family protein n=1 Tax=Brachybacterium sp. NBEC-018 TaxID=2996004 RepID=UPI002174D257|nr:pyridoxal-dependent decarboxylase [Brachybacterium sp. NBEC-018]UVY82606.1 pyridoxal-dependent decarboxylase [Brachybacterium sp. NBEC-018]
MAVLATAPAPSTAARRQTATVVDPPQSPTGPAPSGLLTARTSEDYAALLQRTVDRLADRFASVDAPSAGPDLERLRRLVGAADLDGPGVGSGAALAEADSLYAQNAVWFHHPAYLAHLNCPVAVPAVAAEAMLGAINTSVDTYDQSLVGTLMEQRLVAWTAERIGFTAGDGVFTSGGTQSNLQALFLARTRAERTSGEPRSALLPRLRVLSTDAAHFSVSRSAALLGLDEDAVRTVATDADGRMDPRALRTLLAHLHAAGDTVMAVVATAGTTDRGLVDPIAPIAEVTSAAGVWLHVDAAYGGGLLVSPRRRHLLDGIEHADSVTVDYHKTWFQPVSSSALVVRDPADLAAAAHHADYLNPAAEAASEDAEPNQVDRSLQTTRRFDALKLWTTLRALGPEHIGSMVDAICDLAIAVRAHLEDDPDLHVQGTTDLSTVILRFQPPGVPDAVADDLQARIRRDLFRSGRAMVARTTIDGVPCLKLTLLNPETTVADVAAVLEQVRATGEQLLAGTEATR